MTAACKKLIDAARVIQTQLHERTHRHHQDRVASFVSGVVCLERQLLALDEAIAEAEAELNDDAGTAQS